ncbi:hypothetical protein E2C01_061022 [Portunus trituberculatus]|uniref:Uncharacterized protein n=1 Tax=Portunus trituberculatus TaxID=210409 RepID=A0A5B7HA93_PORTR|nr:hypothetical protein [Portunus trituberculatus]
MRRQPNTLTQEHRSRKLVASKYMLGQAEGERQKAAMRAKTVPPDRGLGFGIWKPSSRLDAFLPSDRGQDLSQEIEVHVRDNSQPQEKELCRQYDHAPFTFCSLHVPILTSSSVHSPYLPSQIDSRPLKRKDDTQLYKRNSDLFFVQDLIKFFNFSFTFFEIAIVLGVIKVASHLSSAFPLVEACTETGLEIRGK